MCKPNRNTIHIVPAGDCWCADWSNTSRADEIEGYFGTTLIPTPFNRLADVESVKSMVARLNPGFLVESIICGGSSC